MSILKSEAVSVKSGAAKSGRAKPEENGKPERFDYPVRLVTTDCHLGGVRWWFICPLTKNGVALLESTTADSVPSSL